jgi:hypothetical protein
MNAIASPRKPLGMLLAAIAAVLAGCGGEHQCTVPEGADAEWMRVLGCERDYALLWDERADAVFANTRTINWLIDREDQSRVYFIDSVSWTLHYYFAAAYLNLPGKTAVGSHEEFNLLNYRRENRRFVLGKLITYVDQGLITLEMSAGDTAGADMIVDAYRHISAAIYNGDQLLYRPVSARQEGLLDELRGRIPVIESEAVFRGQVYQPLNQGRGYGVLRFRRVAELAGQGPAPTDLVVLDRVPNDISMVAGIITAEFQTPLAHVNILSRNRGTPNMGLRHAFDDPALRALEDQLVRLDVGAQGYAVAPASAAEAQAYWDSLRPAEPLIPVFDSSVVELTDIASIGAGASVFVGAKAANMAEMTRIGQAGAIPLPERPFAIPFARYEQHLIENQIAPLIDELLSDMESAPLEPAELAARLFAIRWAIFRAPMDPDFRAALAAEVRARFGDARRVRFRSSTNVEDLARFSGAGLYTSAGASLAEGEQAIEDAVKVVWASTWNRQAFVERDFYRVDHRHVRMAVLVHPSFAGELANGVAITINEFNLRRPAYYMNSQVGEVSVTNPTGQAIPEQILYYTWYEEPEYEVITRSSLLAEPGAWPAGHAVFTDAELHELASYLEAIHGHFRALHQGGQDFAMDVEFKLAPGRQLMIKQARPLPRPAL